MHHLVICAEEIAPILTVLFTQSFDSGKLPNDWLAANITPVFKKGDKTNPKTIETYLIDIPLQ